MASMVNMNNLLNGKDSRWLQLEVCREFQRNKCSRPDTECKFAHPPANVEVQNGRVTACYDSIKVIIQITVFFINQYFFLLSTFSNDNQKKRKSKSNKQTLFLSARKLASQPSERASNLVFNLVLLFASTLLKYYIFTIYIYPYKSMFISDATAKFPSLKIEQIL